MYPRVLDDIVALKKDLHTGRGEGRDRSCDRYQCSALAHRITQRTGMPSVAFASYGRGGRPIARPIENALEDTQGSLDAGSRHMRNVSDAQMDCKRVPSAEPSPLLARPPAMRALCPCHDVVAAALLPPTVSCGQHKFLIRMT